MSIDDSTKRKALRMLDEGISPSIVARDCEVTRATVYNWKKERDGFPVRYNLENEEAKAIAMEYLSSGSLDIKPIVDKYAEKFGAMHILLAIAAELKDMYRSLESLSRDSALLKEIAEERKAQIKRLEEDNAFLKDLLTRMTQK